MATYEFQGKTAEDAIEKACRTLSLKKDGMEIEILEPGSAGIFGLVGGRKAKIKVCIPERESKPREEPEQETKQETKQEPVQRSEQGTRQTIDQPIEAAGEKNGLAVAKEALENILTLIPMESTTVTAEQMNGIISLDIEGDKSGLLIGRKGRTLDALQFIVNKIVNKTLERRTQVVVDSESYRKRRKEFLTQMALQMGSKAKRIKKPVATNLLYPHDRRIVHLALRDDGELSTKSRGDGLFKKVIIIPRG